MNPLDEIKTTITLSMGTKNRLRKLKGSHNYEDYINYLIRSGVENKAPDNLIEVQKFERKTAVYVYVYRKNPFTDTTPPSYSKAVGEHGFHILFSYNKFSPIPGFQFDIRVEKVQHDAQPVPITDFVREIAINTKGFGIPNNVTIEHLKRSNIIDTRDVNPHNFDDKIRERFRHLKDLGRAELEIYFSLLATAIRVEIEPNFNHNGRVEDYFSWEQEFEILRIPKSSLEEDVKDKLRMNQFGERILP